jgi:hypothetical protein
MFANKTIPLTLTGLAVCCVLHAALAAPSVSRHPVSIFSGSTNDYPYAGKPGFTATGKILNVDSDRDLVTLLADDGTTYTIDTRGSQISLRVVDKTGNIDDLTRDMRVHVSGNLLSGNLIAANQVDVLPVTTTTKLPNKPVAQPQTSQRYPISLRGTVENVNNDEGSFDVRINTHQRTVYVSNETRFPNLFVPGRDVPLSPGDRVSVEGKLEADGTVSAAVVHLEQSIHSLHELTGRVTTQSSPLYTRDIEVRLDSGPVVKIKVPKDIEINRGDDEVSVHSLTTDDVLHIEGAFDGDNFVASKIDVVQAEAQVDSN